MSVTIRLDASGLTKGLSALELKQIPFALVRAITQTGLDFQKAERIRMEEVFTLRRKDFIEKQGVKLIGGVATKAKPSITFGVDPKADFLNKDEKGGARPTGQGGGIMIPVDVRRNKKDIITHGNRPLQLIANKTGTGAGSVFLLTTKRGRLVPGLYQRTGRGGRGGLKLLFARVTHATLKPLLGFEATFVKTVNENWQKNFAASFAEALRTAK